MLTLYRDRGAAADAFAWDVCGAESNVALYCAALGLGSAWVSRLDTGMAGIAGAGRLSRPEGSTHRSSICARTRRPA